MGLRGCAHKGLIPLLLAHTPGMQDPRIPHPMAKSLFPELCGPFPCIHPPKGKPLLLIGLSGRQGEALCWGGWQWAELGCSGWDVPSYVHADPHGAKWNWGWQGKEDLYLHSCSSSLQAGMGPPCSRRLHRTHLPSFLSLS